MTANLLSFPLFYKRPMPLDAKKDAQARLPTRRKLDYAAATNSIPLVLGELAEAARCYPVLFSHEAKPIPIALVGLAGDHNLFVAPAPDDAGVLAWEENMYVPGYVRRYPFILMETAEPGRFTVCADAEGLSSGGDGTALFEADGSPSQAMQESTEFCKVYHVEYARTREWVDALQAEGLLVPHQANIRFDNDQAMTFTGFQVIDMEKFDALPDQKILEWRARGWLAPIYLHQSSTLNWDRLLLRNAKMGLPGKSGKSST